MTHDTSKPLGAPDHRYLLGRDFLAQATIRIVKSALNGVPIGVLALALLSAPTEAKAQATVRRITIESGWGGLGTPRDFTAVIDAQNGAFVYAGQPVDPTQIRAFVTALQSGTVPRPDPANLGVTRASLNDQVPRTRKFSSRARIATPRQQSLLNTSFTDPNKISRVIPGLFAFSRTDDYPFVKVEVTFDDGSRLTAGTHSYYPLMLPWVIEQDGAQTFNAEISRAVSRLLPRRRRIWGGLNNSLLNFYRIG